MKKFFIISILAILGMFTQIDSFYAAEKCGINGLDSSVAATTSGYTRLNGSTGSNEANYGLTTGSGEWAAEFSYGTVWGMAKCSETSGNNSSNTWPESSKSDWLKTPSDTKGQYCWCQATGFTASGNDYTSGPQCTVSPVSSWWVFVYKEGSLDNCLQYCAYRCAYRFANVADEYSVFREAVFGEVAKSVAMNWYDNGVQMSVSSSCSLGDTFVPPIPPVRPGYVFTGWHETCASKIKRLDTSINGIASGYARLNSSTGENQSNYGLTTGSGRWAAEFDYGTVWGMSNCRSSKSSQYSVSEGSPGTSGIQCWCQVIGFSPYGADYTQGPQCLTGSSRMWLYYSDVGKASSCASRCSSYCVAGAKNNATFRANSFRAVNSGN